VDLMDDRQYITPVVNGHKVSTSVRRVTGRWILMLVTPQMELQLEKALVLYTFRQTFIPRPHC
jgi:hypothetical protein